MRELKWLDAAGTRAQAGELAAVLLDCVAGGASVSFMADLQLEGARDFFTSVAADVIARGRTLLTFDTLTGTAAERMYLACGCVKVGEIPRYALLPGGGIPAPTSIFYKTLGP